MALRTEAFRDNPNRLAFLYGPIVLAGDIAPRKPAPDIVTMNGSILSGLKPLSGKPLEFISAPDEFHAIDQDSGEAIRFSPFYAAYDRTYAVYWDKLTPAEFAAKRNEHAEEIRRMKEVAARTIDSVDPGNPRSEESHRGEGESSYGGDFGDRHWRDARSGGWFSYRFKVEPGVAQDLVCTYWGGDGGREFDILVDGVRLATQKLTNTHPGKFFEEVYSIPPAMIEGKREVTIKFQGAPGRSAGGGS